MKKSEVNIANLKRMTKRQRDRPSTMGYKPTRNIEYESAEGTLRINDMSPSYDNNLFSATGRFEGDNQNNKELIIDNKEMGDFQEFRANLDH